MIVPNHTGLTPLQQVDEFNRLHPPGTPVRYWTGRREGEGQIANTRGAAFALMGHTAVVMLDVAGGVVALSHVSPLGREVAQR